MKGHTFGTLGGILLGGSGLLAVMTAGGMSPPPDHLGTVTPQVPVLAVAPVTPNHLGFPDGPPARVTGGFGEESCQSCHWEWDENEGPGTLTVKGFPEAYAPGQAYDLAVVLENPVLATAGFQLTIRREEDGGQAGSFVLPDNDRVAMLEDGEVQFVHQTARGNEPDSASGTRWEFRWTAPGSGKATLLLHASAVAGDGDFSQMGDPVYTVELESRKSAGR